MRRSLLFAILTIGAASSAAAQEPGSGQAGPRSILPRDREITLAQSAAPAAVSDSATIYVFTDHGYEVAVRGTNGAACYVSRSWIDAIEPHCFDVEGAETIMRMEMRQVELMHQGKSPAEAEREVAAGVLSGAFRLPRRPAVSYMLSAAQELISDTGRRVGPWKPHLMIYYPYLTAADAGLSETAPSAGLLMVGSGTASANLMVVVPDFVQPRFTTSAGR